MVETTTWNYDIVAKAKTQSEKQQYKILLKKLDCIGEELKSRTENATVNSTELRCPRSWDGIVCWPPTEAGTTAVLPCPDYVENINLFGFAQRRCTPEGRWWVNPQKNKTWTDFSDCSQKSEEDKLSYFQELYPHMRITYSVGYGLSLFFLILAIFVMFYFKRVHCPRNTIHINLFLAFILRAASNFIRESAIVAGTGFDTQDLVQNEEGKYVLTTNVSHWECKAFFTVFHYIQLASYVWIFVEAFYLQMLISVSVFSEKNRLRWYIALGWLLPAVIMIPWIIIRATIDDENCWNTYNLKWLLWVIYGPVTVLLLINIGIFINIVRILFTKLTSAPCKETKKFRYRRLAKSTLILIPLFGIYYVVFMYNTYLGDIQSKSTVIVLFLEMTLNSFQGFLLSLLFCFVNSEIRNEIRKAWNKKRLKRSSTIGRQTYKFSSFSKSFKGAFSSNGMTVHQNGHQHQETLKLDISPSSDECIPHFSLANGHVETDLSHNPQLCGSSEDSPCLDDNLNSLKTEETALDR